MAEPTCAVDGALRCGREFGDAGDRDLVLPEAVARPDQRAVLVLRLNQRGNQRLIVNVTPRPKHRDSRRSDLSFDDTYHRPRGRGGYTAALLN